MKIRIGKTPTGFLKISFFLSAFVSFLVDRISKFFLSRYFEATDNKEINIFENFLKLGFYKNKGIAFSLLENFGNIILVINLAIILVLSLFAIKKNLQCSKSVSYTHLTLPTIYSV